ncbi:unnamed protein product [Microthlaspi erraticum]|uniref:Secreted protein n=1 Tax=Microthlaspi erraticum TaxID=1685480 RepID=A0A6D2HU38_9BRAS|nr:unnamed protein product [Microthlaspi erraticum]
MLARSSLRLLFFFLEVCVAPLALVELAARTVVWVPSALGSPGKVLDRTRIQGSRKGSSGQLDLSSTELSFLCLDSIESTGRVGASALELFLLLCVLSPSSLGSNERLCEALGQGASLGGEKDLLLGNVGAMGVFFFLDEEPETFFSKLLILLTILSMDFCIFSCHLLNFWRSPILL